MVHVERPRPTFPTSSLDGGRRRWRRRAWPIALSLVLLGGAACGGASGEEDAAAVPSGGGGDVAAPTTTTTVPRRARPEAGAELVSGMAAEGYLTGPAQRSTAAHWRVPIMFTTVQVDGSSQVNVHVDEADLVCESGVPARPTDHLGENGMVRITRAGAEADEAVPGVVTASLVLVSGC